MFYLHVQPFRRNAQLVQQALPCIRVLRVGPFFDFLLCFFVVVVVLILLKCSLFDVNQGWCAACTSNVERGHVGCCNYKTYYYGVF